MAYYELIAFSDSDMRGEVQKVVDQMGTQKEAARWLGISEQYLSDILKKRRAISEQVAAKLGYKPYPLWVKAS